VRVAAPSEIVWTERLLALPRARGLADLPTPFLAIDLDTLEENLEAMQRFSDARPGGLAPHVKSHKCSAIARRQLVGGAAGLTCATTDEVAAMAGAGLEPIVLASVVTDAVRVRQLAETAETARIVAAVDSPEGAALVAAAARARGVELETVIECDIGMGRNGVSDLDEGLRLAGAIERLEGVRLSGVMAYEGHLVDVADRAERARRSLDAMQWPLELLRELRRTGFEAPIFTGGSTSTHDSTGALPELTHLQAGTYALMDPVYRRLTPEFDPALAIVASVLTRKGERLVLDFGAKRSGGDWGRPELVGAEADHLYTAEEHTVFRLNGSSGIQVGERVAVLPPHSCTTMNLYSRAFGCRRGRLDEILEIDGRDPMLGSA
jgi:D-serine deaminase-like pyridoxal phosphate-dependent protein